MKYLIEDNRLSALSTDKKLALTMFLVLIASGYLTGILMALQQSGTGQQGIATYYLGDETQLIFPKTYRGILENTHFHLFSMAIIFLALSHLFLICILSYRLKVWLISLSFSGLMAEVASPWLIRFGAPQWAWLMVVSGPLLSIASFVMVALIVRELWFRKLAVNSNTK